MMISCYRCKEKQRSNAHYCHSCGRMNMGMWEFLFTYTVFFIGLPSLFLYFLGTIVYEGIRRLWDIKYTIEYDKE